MELHDRFVKLWKNTGAQGDADRVFGWLETRYSESHRAYHTLKHVDDCLAEFKTVKHLAEKPNEVKLAIWFSDAVYEVGVEALKKSNEERSAKLAFDMLRKADVSFDRAEYVRRLILATNHNEDPVLTDARLVADIDLAILGQPEDVYDKYEQDIRKEFAWAPDEEFRKGRMKVIDKFLGRRIYYTDHFYQKYEKLAMHNLERALVRL